MNSDTAEGSLRDIGGKVKEAVGDIAGDSKTTLEGKADQAIGAGQKAYGTAREAVSEGAEQARGLAQDIAGAAGRTASWVSSEAAELSDMALAQAGQARKYATSQVQEKPVTMLLLAGLVGGIIGHVLSSASRR